LSHWDCGFCCMLFVKLMQISRAELRGAAFCTAWVKGVAIPFYAAALMRD
jgi:hypothetical protein